MGRFTQYVKSFRIDYERDENWRTFYPNRDFETVNKNVGLSFGPYRCVPASCYYRSRVDSII